MNGKQKFCCAGFENAVAKAGMQGIAILVRREHQVFYFELQSRGIAYEDEDKIRPIPVDLNINVSSSTGLRFCPWCGKPVEKMVDSDRDFFVELAKKHQGFRTLPL